MTEKSHCPLGLVPPRGAGGSHQNWATQTKRSEEK